MERKAQSTKYGKIVRCPKCDVLHSPISTSSLVSGLRTIPLGLVTSSNPSKPSCSKKIKLLIPALKLSCLKWTYNGKAVASFLAGVKKEQQITQKWSQNVRLKYSTSYPDINRLLTNIHFTIKELQITVVHLHIPWLTMTFSSFPRP